MATRKVRLFMIISLGILLIGSSGALICKLIVPANRFDGQRAYQDVIAQVSLGARTPGSDAHAQAIAYITQELDKAGWKVQLQTTDWSGFSVNNIIAYRSEIPPQILFGAHYDSRLQADQDVGSRKKLPVPGANDGASGVSILLELARTIPDNSPPIWLVFFDAEDNGGLENRQWIMGSRAFVASLTEKPSSAIIVDMVGDADLDLYIEKNSDPGLVKEIWGQAADLGYGEIFIEIQKYSLLDDHTAFLEAGIAAVDIIDFDYPYWHTLADTADQVSALSLDAVGETLLAWIESK